VTDRHRNELIFDDLLKALEMGRSPLLLTERREHLEWFAEHLKGFAQNVIILMGGMGVKQRKSLSEQIKAVPDSKERVIIATGRYIGEGFDDARLDTLFLAMPISWRGTLQQYVGRLHRVHDIHNAISNCASMNHMIYCFHEPINHSRCVNHCSWITG
jgi:superfamily II DNA or RNA helicase